MSIGIRAAAALAGLMLSFGGAQAKDDARKVAADAIKKHMEGDEEGVSPFRKALKAKQKERKAQRKGFPADVTFAEPVLEENENGLGWGKGDCAEKGRCPTPGYVVRYSVKTEIRYAGPDELHDPAPGKEKATWPELKVRNYVKNASGEWEFDPATELDYTQAYKQLVAERAAAEGKVAWKDDDPENGLYEFGREPLEEEITEDVTFTFKKGDEAQAKAFFRRLYAALQAGEASVESAILMGFTYTGPNIDYTVGSKKKVCLFGGCAVIWDIRAGFALDYGLGLRLPAVSRIEGPSSMVVGPTPYTFRSYIDAQDWSAGQYGAVGAAGESGNEFVMRMEMFAGAKVEILGANVCPYCQYVELDEDYGKTFTTPFGAGASFPIPAMTIPVKSWNYGIVALDVGLRLTPTLGSNTISAWTNDGQRLDHSAGSPREFSVTACIPGESAVRSQTVEIDQYQYWFNNFQLTLGAYLNLSVGGYGAWNPAFDFLTLDLSGALGSTGLYLGDHLQCDWAFNCVAAPVDQRVRFTSALLDQTPPQTSLDLAGTAGANGWWVSDVAGVLTPVDHPIGCGSGPGGTSWGLSPAALTPGKVFTLSAEGEMTVYWQTSDKDLNLEPLNSRGVKIDKTPPTISGAATTAPNVRGWYNADVTVHFDASDAVSGVASLTPDTVLSDEAAGQSVTGEAVDYAGLTANTTVGGINIDKTAPVTTIASPQATGYKAGDTLVLDWEIVDPLSGMLSSGATLDGRTSTLATGVAIVEGATIDMAELTGGNHELVVTATDNADNVRVSTVTFLLDVDIDGLIRAVEFCRENGWLTQGAYKSLIAKAREAKRKLESGVPGGENGARGSLNAFAAEIRAQRDKKGVKETAFGILYPDVQYVLDRYKLSGPP